MRMLRLASVALVLAGVAFAQPPGGGGGRGGRGGDRGGFGGGPGGGGGMRMMMGNPDQMFDFFAKGKDVIKRDDLDPMFQRFFDRMASQLNITNGQITREQAKQAGEQMQQRFGGGGFGGGGRGPGGDRGNNDAFAKSRFDRYDKNGDGVLSPDEMPDALKAERDKWDTDKNGVIDFNEFKAYMDSRLGSRNDRQADDPGAKTNATDDRSVNPMPMPEPEPDMKRPVVFRYGHLPDGLPSWFTELDIDKDGQVGLYEWVKGGRSINEFREMDANDDGFLTAEEVLRHLAGGNPGNMYASASVSSDREPAYRMNNRDRSAGGGDRMSMSTGNGFNSRGGGNGFNSRGGNGFSPRGGDRSGMGGGNSFNRGNFGDWSAGGERSKGGRNKGGEKGGSDNSERRGRNKGGEKGGPYGGRSE